MELKIEKASENLENLRMPSLGVHIPDDWEYAPALRKRLKEHYRNKASPYLLSLIEKDLQGLSVGGPESAFSLEQIRTWMIAEAKLSRAAKLALSVLHAETTESRHNAGKELAAYILNALQREDPESADMLAAETAAKYMTPLVVSTDNIQLADRSKKAAS